MPLLLYCVLRAETQPKVPARGVDAGEVLQSEQGSLRFWYSEISDERFRVLDVKSAALEFHEVVQAAFAEAAVIPFRYGTLVTTLDELQDRHAGFFRELERLGDSVQMEVRLVPSTSPGAASSGTEYLRARQAALHSVSSAAEVARQAVADLILEWRQKGTRTGIRCFALVPRSAIEGFRTRLRDTAFGRDVSVRVSGPWPPAEFLELQSITEPDIVGPPDG
jgi:hypothetical protein